MPALKFMLIALVAVPQLAHADLFRWVDPVSGSIKYSNSPPVWMDGAGRGPSVQVVPYHAAAPAFSPQSAVNPAAADSAAGIGALEAQWHGLLKGFAQLPERPDSERSATVLQQQLQNYERIGAELDRRDPTGSARRRAEEASAMERIRKRLQAQSGNPQFGNRIAPVQK